MGVRGLGALLAIVALTLSAGAQQPPEPPQTQAQQRPVFRAGTHFVRVDAYPTQDGQIVEGLEADDFEILEDGKPQKVETVEFIEYAGWNPNAARTDPNSQRDAFQLAADPKYRIFVLYLDAYHVGIDGSHRLRAPITQLLNRMLGPNDLFGMLTPVQRPRLDLMLGRLSLSIEEQLTRNWDWGQANWNQPIYDEAEAEIVAALGERRGRAVVMLRRLDDVYGDLEELVTLLGELRDERKNILFFSDFLESPPLLTSALTTGQTSPRIGVSNEGQLTMGARNSAEPDRMRVEAEEARLRSIDFQMRFRDLLRYARQMNVAFYTIRPGGVGSFNMMSDGVGNLLSLADQTDGLAIAGTNDLQSGLKRIADDLSSHYVLGYYTSNTNWNGAPRRITVKLKATGDTIRSRREYRAPTEAEMASIREVRAASAAAPAEPAAEAVALDLLTRLRPGARFHVYGSAAGSQLAVVAELAGFEIEEGRWKAGADLQVMATPRTGEAVVARGRIEPGARGTIVHVPVGSGSGPWDVNVRARGGAEAPESATVTVARPTTTLLGDATAYRAASAASAAFRPLAAFQFRRTERIRVDWPILGAIDTHEARLLDRRGQPAPVPVVVTRSADGKLVSATLNLAPLSTGDYLIEMTAKAGGKVERKLVAIRVSLAR
jgi:VWFA-related protein